MFETKYVLLDDGTIAPFYQGFCSVGNKVKVRYYDTKGIIVYKEGMIKRIISNDERSYEAAFNKLSEIENFCRYNWNYINKKQDNIVTDYTDGLKQAFREIIDGYFGGL